jgi:hypothetical protein
MKKEDEGELASGELSPTLLRLGDELSESVEVINSGAELSATLTKREERVLDSAEPSSTYRAVTDELG